MRAWSVFVAVAVLSHFAAVAEAQGKVVCYLGSWSTYRPGNGKYNIEDIDTQLCTHLIYSFVGITSSGGINVLDTWNDLPSGKDGFRRFTSLKASNPSAKFLVAIGGWNEGSLAYSKVMANPTTRAAFVNNAVSFVKKYNFDGFDLDWEYPAQRGGASHDKVNFVKLLQELRERFDREGLLLTAAVGAGQSSVDISYDVPALSKYLDFINVMTYDLHGSWEPITGQNAPLYASNLDRTSHEKTLNVKAAIENWIAKGASPSKLVMGIGTYGQSFTLSTSSKGLGAPASGPGNQGPYTQQAGMLGYNEICELQNKGGWSVNWDNTQQVPFAYNGNLWVGYDNIRSVKAKVEFAKSLGLGGAMIWSLETDDFRGACGEGKYPLLTAINEVLHSGIFGNEIETGESPTVSTSAPVTTSAPVITTAPVTTSDPTSAVTPASPPSTGLCTKQGYVRDPIDCDVFYYCQLVHGTYTAHQYNCQTGLVFDDHALACNYRSLVNC